MSHQITSQNIGVGIPHKLPLPGGREIPPNLRQTLIKKSFQDKKAERIYVKFHHEENKRGYGKEECVVKMEECVIDAFVPLGMQKCPSTTFFHQ